VLNDKRRPGEGAASTARRRVHGTPPLRPEYLRQALEYLIEGLGHVVPERYLRALGFLVADAREAKAIRRFDGGRLV